LSPCETHQLNRAAMGIAARSDTRPICSLNPSYDDLFTRTVEFL
jgi:hypothetical protein